MKLSRFLLTAVISTLFVSCGAKWTTDYDAAVKAAQKKNRDIFLVFTGDDWTDNSIPFKENILNKKEFLSRYSKDYVFLNIDFSQDEFAKTKVADDASDAEKKAAEKIAAEYRRKEVLGRNYSVKVWPAVYLCSAEGYVLEQVIFDADKDTACTVEEYCEKVEAQRSKSAELKVLVEAVRSAKGVEKAKAIDELVKASNPRFSDLYRDLIFEFPVLDAENETGRLGFYELAGAYYISYDATTKNEDPAKPFLDVIETGHLVPDQVQEAYYMAAYSLINGEKFDSAKVTEYLEKAYTTNPAGPNAMKILQNLQQMKRFAELEKIQAESDGE